MRGLMSLFYSANDVFTTYTRIFSSVQLRVNKTSFISPASI